MAKFKSQSKYICCLFAGVALVLPVQAIAQTEGSQQDSAGQGLGEIVVTARKRAENLQDTPISITALGAEEIESRGASDVTKVAGFAPNVTFEGPAPLSGSSSASLVFIRGVGQTDFNQLTDPGVGVYVDGVYLGRSVGQVLSTLDLERVEILRGPQGTLFGRNTIGGAVSVISKKPSRDFEGYVDAAIGRYDRIDLKASLNVPLTDNLFVRLTGATINRDGYVIRLPDGLDLGNQKKLIGRAAVRWEPSDQTTIDLAFDITRERENGPPTYLVAVNTQPVTGQPAGNPPNFAAISNCFAQGLPPVSPPCTNFTGSLTDPRFYNTQWLTGSRFRTFASGPFADPDGFRSDLDLWGVNLTIAHDFGFAEFKSITSYRDTKSDFGRDDDHSPILITATANIYKQQQFSQEFQLTGNAFSDRLKYTTGLFYFVEKGNDRDFVNTPVAYFLSAGDVKNDSLAAFAQATYEVTDALSVTGGLRYTDETKRYSPIQFYITNGAGFPGINAAGQFGVGPDFRFIQPLGERKKKFTEWTPMANIAYKFNEDLLAYATYSKGYKSGGFTQRIFPAQLLVPDFNPEFVDSYELGVKSDWLDRRLRLNLAAFQTEYSDIQVLVQEGFAPQTRNAASGRIRGFEFEASAAPTEGLLLSFGAGYLDAKFTSLGAGVAGITLDSVFPYTPKWSLNGSASYEIPTSLGPITPRVDWTYRSTIYTDSINTPQIVQPGYHLVNLSVAWDLENPKVRLSAGVTNVGNKQYAPVASADLAVKGSAEAHPGRPREWYVSYRFSF